MQLESNLNVHASEKVVESTLSNSTMANLKLGNGHVLNLRFRPTKGFAQYNFGTYNLNQGIRSWFVQPYLFYLNSQYLKKDVAGAGLEIFADPSFRQHVTS